MAGIGPASGADVRARSGRASPRIRQCCGAHAVSLVGPRIRRLASGVADRFLRLRRRGREALPASGTRADDDPEPGDPRADPTPLPFHLRPRGDPGIAADARHRGRAGRACGGTGRGSGQRRRDEPPRGAPARGRAGRAAAARRGRAARRRSRPRVGAQARAHRRAGGPAVPRPGREDADRHHLALDGQGGSRSSSRSAWRRSPWSATA